MTTFEITIITLLGLIAFALIFRDFVIGKALDQIIHNQDAMQQDIQRIEVNTHHVSSVLQDHIAPDIKELRDIEKKNQELLMPAIELLREIRNCLTQDINWGELTDDQKSEILYRLTHPVVESPFKPPFNPTCETTNKED